MVLADELHRALSFGKNAETKNAHSKAAAISPGIWRRLHESATAAGAQLEERRGTLNCSFTPELTANADSVGDHDRKRHPHLHQQGGVVILPYRGRGRVHRPRTARCRSDGRVLCGATRSSTLRQGEHVGKVSIYLRQTKLQWQCHLKQLTLVRFEPRSLRRGFFGG